MIKKDYTFPCVLAVILHIALLSLFFSHLHTTPAQSTFMQASSHPIVNAALVSSSSSAVKPAEIPPTASPVSPAPQSRETAEKASVELKKQAALLEKQQAQSALEKQQRVLAEEKRALLKQQTALLKKQETERLKKQKLEKEAAQLAKLALEKKEKAALEKKAAELAKQEAEKQAKAFAKKEAEKHAKQLAQQAQALAEENLQRQLDADQKQLTAGSQTREMQGEVDQYKALVLQAISQHWIVPSRAGHDLACKLLIRLAPGGMVLNVTLLNGSGDPALDRSAIAAVYKASPLPVPTDAAVFDQFREFNLTVKPENTA